jgi:ClpP class serine protease
VASLLLNEITGKIHALRVFSEAAEGVLRELEGVAGIPVVPLLFSPRRYIDPGAVDSIYTVLKEVDASRGLGVVLFSMGGDINEAYILATLLQDTAGGRLVFYIPRYAKSAATLLALSGDEVVMLPVAELGPVDPVIYDSKTERYIPLASILEVLDMLGQKNFPGELAKAVLERIPVVELGDYKRAVEHNAELCQRILARRMMRDNPDKAREVALKLVSYKQHSAAITLRDLAEMGVKARAPEGREAELLWRLHQLWVENVIEYEEVTPFEATELVEFKLGRGIVLTTALIDQTQR